MKDHIYPEEFKDSAIARRIKHYFRCKDCSYEAHEMEFARLNEILCPNCGSTSLAEVYKWIGE